jgi:hypothetical protein
MAKLLMLADLVVVAVLAELPSSLIVTWAVKFPACA